MKRLLFSGGAALLVVSFACCSKKPDVTCARSKQGCTCKNEVFPLEAGWTPVSSCDAPSVEPGVVATCCHDVDSAGETSVCMCWSAVCWRTDGPAGPGTCACETRMILPGDATSAA